MVSKLFDTSSLFAGVLTVHPSYVWSMEQLRQVNAGETAGLVCTHGFAELYSGLTSHPQTRYKPSFAEKIIERLLEKFTIITLDAPDYRAAIARARQLGLTGGAIYDVLHAQAFLKANADSLVTLNAKHFLRLGEDIAPKVEAPD